MFFNQKPKDGDGPQQKSEDAKSMPGLPVAGPKTTKIPTIKISSSSIHTMQKDLAEIKNPNAKKIEEIEIEAKPAESDFSFNRGGSEIPKSNPFMNPYEIKGPAISSVTPKPAPSQMPTLATAPMPVPKPSPAPAPKPLYVQSPTPAPKSFYAPSPSEAPTPIPKPTPPPAPVSKKPEGTITFKDVSNPALQFDEMPKVKLSSPIIPSKPKPIEISQEVPKKAVNWGKTLMIVLVILIILVLGSGAYYFFMIKQAPKIEEPPIITPPVEPPVVIPPVEPPVVTPAFNPDKSNYLSLDLSVADATAVKTTLQKFITDVMSSDIATPVEFSIVDAQNNPITFKNFSDKLGLVLPANILADLSDNFSFYIYKDVANPGIGLALDSKNDTTLSASMSAEEKNLITDLKPFLSLIINSDYRPSETVFSTNDYNGIKTRYINIVTPNILSVDYAVNKNKLIIGTTMLTFRSIADKINNSTVTPSGSDSSNPDISLPANTGDDFNNCGTLVTDHIFVSPPLTSEDKKALDCFNSSVSKCQPATLSENSPSTGAESEVSISGKENDNCIINNKEIRAASGGNTLKLESYSTCKLPMEKYITPMYNEAIKQNKPELFLIGIVMVFIKSSTHTVQDNGWYMAEITNTQTQEKISIQCK